jgi:transposase
MPNPGKPIMGYPNRRAAVKALLDEGLGREDIAVRLGLGADIVRVALRDLREAGAVIPPPRTRGPTRAGKDKQPTAAVVELRAPAAGVSLAAATRASAVGVRQSATLASETRFRLQKPDGAGESALCGAQPLYLHMSIVGSDGELAFTRERAWSWLGYRAQLQAVLRAHAAAKRLTAVRVMPEPKTDLFVGARA